MADPLKKLSKADLQLLADDKLESMSSAGLRIVSSMSGDIPQTKQPSSLESAVAMGQQDVANQLPTRFDFLKRFAQNVAKPDWLGTGVIAPIQAAVGVPQRGEAAIANSAMAMQDWLKNTQQNGALKGSAQTLGNVAIGAYQGITGEKLGQLGDVYQRAGASPEVSATAGLATTLLGGQAAAKALGVSKLFPTINTDEHIVNAGKNIANTIETKIGQLRTSYEQMFKPHFDQMVNSDTFGNLIKKLPADLREEFAQKFGDSILNAQGKQGSTVGNLYKMRLAVEDLVQQAKNPISRMGEHSGRLAELSVEIKDSYLKQLPAVSQNIIKQLDKTFGPVIERGSAVLGKVVGKGGEINTNYLARIFKNPDSSGSRVFLKELANYGIDLSGSIKVFKSYAAREGQKKFLRYAAQHIPTAIGVGVIGRAIHDKS